MNSHCKHTVTETSRVEQIRSYPSCRPACGEGMSGLGHDVNGGVTLT